MSNDVKKENKEKGGCTCIKPQKREQLSITYNISTRANRRKLEKLVVNSIDEIRDNFVSKNTIIKCDIEKAMHKANGKEYILTLKISIFIEKICFNKAKSELLLTFAYLLMQLKHIINAKEPQKMELKHEFYGKPAISNPLHFELLMEKLGYQKSYSDSNSYGIGLDKYNFKITFEENKNIILCSCGGSETDKYLAQATNMFNEISRFHIEELPKIY